MFYGKQCKWSIEITMKNIFEECIRVETEFTLKMNAKAQNSRVVSTINPNNRVRSLVHLDTKRKGLSSHHAKQS